MLGEGRETGSLVKGSAGTWRSRGAPSASGAVDGRSPLSCWSAAHRFACHVADAGTLPVRLVCGGGAPGVLSGGGDGPRLGLPRLERSAVGCRRQHLHDVLADAGGRALQRALAKVFLRAVGPRLERHDAALEWDVGARPERRTLRAAVAELVDVLPQHVRPRRARQAWPELFAPGSMCDADARRLRDQRAPCGAGRAIQLPHMLSASRLGASRLPHWLVHVGCRIR